MTRTQKYPHILSVRVSSWAKDRLTEAADEQKVDVSDVVRVAIDQYAKTLGAGISENWVHVPNDREIRSSYTVVLTPEWLKECETAVRRMGMNLGQAMREGVLHLVRGHMPLLCSQCGGSKDDPQTYCKPWGHDIHCMHRFHFDDEAAWSEAVGMEPVPDGDGGTTMVDFPLSTEELAVVGRPSDYNRGNPLHDPA